MQSFIGFDQTKKFAAWAVLKNKNGVVSHFKSKFQANDKRMIKFFHYVFFINNDLFPFLLDQIIFLNNFHRIKLTIFLKLT